MLNYQRVHYIFTYIYWVDGRPGIQVWMMCDVWLISLGWSHSITGALFFNLRRYQSWEFFPQGSLCELGNIEVEPTPTRPRVTPHILPFPIGNDVTLRETRAFPCTFRDDDHRKSYQVMPPSSKFIDGNIESYNNYVMVTTLWIQIVPEKILNPPNHTPVPFPKEVWLEG